MLMVEDKNLPSNKRSSFLGKPVARLFRVKDYHTTGGEKLI